MGAAAPLSAPGKPDRSKTASAFSAADHRYAKYGSSCGDRILGNGVTVPRYLQSKQRLAKRRGLKTAGTLVANTSREACIVFKVHPGIVPKATRRGCRAKKERSMKKFTAVLATAALMMLTASAWATPITGTISFIGSGHTTPNAAAIINATGLFFGDSQVAGTNTGTYSAIAVGTPVAFTDFTFNPSSGLPMESFWTLTSLGNTYSFDLNAINIDYQSQYFLNLLGEGVLHATGYDPTPGYWFYSSQDGATAFSAESSTAPVPEPGTVALLGAGLFVLAVYGKRRLNRDNSCNA